MESERSLVEKMFLSGLFVFAGGALAWGCSLHRPSANRDSECHERFLEYQDLRSSCSVDKNWEDCLACEDSVEYLSETCDSKLAVDPKLCHIAPTNSQRK